MPRDSAPPPRRATVTSPPPPAEAPAPAPPAPGRSTPKSPPRNGGLGGLASSVDPVFPEVARLELNDLLSQLIDRAQEVMGAQDRLRVLLRGTRAVAADLALSVVLHQIVESARELADASYAALGVIGPDGTLTQFVHVGIDPGTVGQIGDLPQGRGILGLLTHDPRPIRLPDLNQHADASGFPAGHPPMKSFLGVPIRVREEVYGNLYLTEKRDGAPFTGEDEELVVALATTAAVAIQNARLYEETLRRQRWQQASTEITAALLSGAGPAEALVMIADQARILMDADDAVVLGADAAPPAGGAAGGTTLSVALAGAGRPAGSLRVSRLPGREAFSAEDRELAQTFAEQAALVLELARVRADAERVRMLEERERIARDMHDHVIGRLFGAGLSVQSLARWIDDPEGERRLAAHVDELDGVIRDIRTSIYALSRGRDDAWTPPARIRQVVSESAAHLGFDPLVRLAEPLGLQPASPLVDQLLAVLREALTNIARHAGATQVEVVVEVGEVIRLQVRDNGRGLPEAGAGQPGRRADGGHGLVNMAHRAEVLGGSFGVTALPSGGTALVWEVPRRAGG